jgi:hypothetical protein
MGTLERLATLRLTVDAADTAAAANKHSTSKDQLAAADTWQSHISVTSV